MATVYANASDQFQVQWYEGPTRRTVYLGKVPADFADEACLYIGKLVQAREYGRPLDRRTSHWLSEIPRKLLAKLQERGLVERESVVTLEALCDHCIRLAQVEPSTMQKYHDAKTNLVDHFGAARDISLITPGDCDEFKVWLGKYGRRPKRGPLAETTVSKRLQQARQFFKTAVRKKWISDNPFEGVSVAASTPTDRRFYVTRETTKALMDAAEPELKLMIALARFAGLRVPSELIPLEWAWIDQENDVLRVLSTKNKRFEHKKWRFVPLFPEIRQLLLEAWRAAPRGAVHLFPGLSEVTATAVRNRLQRHCLNCGVIPWPKLWQNMRSTRETELMDAGFPPPVVCEWLNNSPAVAYRHYYQIAKEHVARAVSSEIAEFSTPVRTVSAKSSAKRA